MNNRKMILAMLIIGILCTRYGELVRNNLLVKQYNNIRNLRIKENL